MLCGLPTYLKHLLRGARPRNGDDVDTIDLPTQQSTTSPCHPAPVVTAEPSPEALVLKPSSSSTSSPATQPTLDYSSFPHIVEQIIDYVIASADHDAIDALRLTSQSIMEAVDDRLPSHMVFRRDGRTVIGTSTTFDVPLEDISRVSLDHAHKAARKRKDISVPYVIPGLIRVLDMEVNNPTQLQMFLLRKMDQLAMIRFDHDQCERFSKLPMTCVMFYDGHEQMHTLYVDPELSPLQHPLPATRQSALPMFLTRLNSPWEPMGAKKVVINIRRSPPHYLALDINLIWPRMRIPHTVSEVVIVITLHPKAEEEAPDAFTSATAELADPRQGGPALVYVSYQALVDGMLFITHRTLHNNREKGFPGHTKFTFVDTESWHMRWISRKLRAQHPTIQDVPSLIKLFIRNGLKKDGWNEAGIDHALASCVSLPTLEQYKARIGAYDFALEMGL